MELIRPSDLARLLETAESAVSEACLKSWIDAHPGDAMGSGSEAVAGGRAFFFGSLSPLSQALSIGMAGPVFDEEFDRLEAFFVGRGAPVVISLCPFADSSVLDRLMRRRYRITHFENILVREIRGDEAFLDAPGVAVRPAGAGEEMLWSRTVMRGFAESGDVNPEMVRMFSVFFGAERATPYLAVVGGRAAAGATLSVQPAVCMFYGDATLPEFRGRGIQTALIAARLRHAAAAGCRWATAGTLPGSQSQRNYERAGFHVAYTKTMLVRDGL